jgi:hypothetical protein
MNILSIILSLLPIFIVLVLLIWRKMAAALAAPSCAFFKGSAGCNLAHLFYNYGVLHTTNKKAADDLAHFYVNRLDVYEYFE